MSDLISRQAVIDRINKLIEVEKKQGTDDWGYGRERVNAYEAMLHFVKSEYLHPSVEPERKTGKWVSAPKGKSICISDEMTDTFLRLPIALCSNCGEVVPVIGRWKRYCPMCGAKKEAADNAESEDKE